jgi:hypothetical protein
MRLPKRETGRRGGKFANRQATYIQADARQRRPRVCGHGNAATTSVGAVNASEREYTMKKKFSKVLVFALIFSLVCVSSLAAWPQYQGDGNHSGQITNGTPPTSPPTSVVSTSLGNGISTESVLNTEDNVTYSYTLTNGGDLVKINVAAPGGGSGSGEWIVNFPNSSGYQLGSPALIATGTYAGVYVSVTDYFELLTDPQFDDPSLGVWVTSGGAVINTGSASIPDGGSIAQKFIYGGITTAQASELISQASSSTSNPAKVTYTITDGGGSIIATYTIATDPSTDPAYLAEFFSTAMVPGQGYMITVNASGGDVDVDHVSFSYQTSGIEKVSFDGLTITNIAVSPNGGQANTPLTIYDNYLYYGTISGPTNYFQVDLTAPVGTNVLSYSSGNREYWAGAVEVTIDKTNYVVFGSDGGYLHLSEVGANFANAGTQIDLSQVVSGITNPGNVRSTVSLSGNDSNIYFTSQGGYLWRADVSTLLSASPTFAAIALPAGVSSTSTPAISENGYIYAGYYEGFSSGGVVAATDTDFANPVAPSSVLDNIYTVDPVQSSPIVWSTEDDEDYIYFTTNSSNGKGYCYYWVVGDDTTINEEWAAGGTSGNPYAVQGFSADGGYLVYGDDGNNLYIVH